MTVDSAETLITAVPSTVDHSSGKLSISGDSDSKLQNNDSETTIVVGEEDEDEGNEHEQKQEQEQEQQEIIPERIFVGNLPYEVSEDDVRNLTPEFTVVSVEIPRKQFLDKHLNEFVLQSKGYGFITYINAEDAKLAIDSIVGKQIAGREIYAKYALPQNKNKFKLGSTPPGTRHNQFPPSFKTKRVYYPPQMESSLQPQSQHQPNNVPMFYPPPPPGAPGAPGPYPVPMGPMMTPMGPYPPFSPYPPPYQNSMPVQMNTPPESSSDSESSEPQRKLDLDIDIKAIKPFFPTAINISHNTSNTSNSSTNNNPYPAGAYIYPPGTQSSRHSHSSKPFKSQRLYSQQRKEEKLKKLENGKPSNTIVFIGNLDRYINDEELKEFLKAYSPVSMKVPKVSPHHHQNHHDLYRNARSDGLKLQNRGIAFVKFANNETQRKVIEDLHETIWNGKKLNVAVAINAYDDDDDENENENDNEHNNENENDNEIEHENENENENEDADTSAPEPHTQLPVAADDADAEDDTEIEVVVSDDN